MGERSDFWKGELEGEEKEEEEGRVAKEGRHGDLDEQMQQKVGEEEVIPRHQDEKERQGRALLLILNLSLSGIFDHCVYNRSIITTRHAHTI